MFDRIMLMENFSIENIISWVSECFFFSILPFLFSYILSMMRSKVLLLLLCLTLILTCRVAALFRWGMTLQQRSRLRPGSSKEKVKLLQQAKRLYEDALDMDSNNIQVKDALSSCVSELNYRRY